ncbi:unnamed protein product [Phytophthora fragariaefolia]|uniref:Unnamed protein product n=1 Tax=Phytophthora fragariaefolia TaxID=1490495 RepID=A0A9W6U182_9STRA|nr:unnamed protein product [Phytophthora fragariaefolia]
MTGDSKRSKNTGMRELLSKVTTTISEVRAVEVMADLYAELIAMLGFGKERKLVGYKPHRFMGLTPVFRRILKHWAVLEMWYEERARKFEQGGNDLPNPFPLTGRKLEMEQLLWRSAFRKWEVSEESPGSDLMPHGTIIPIHRIRSSEGCNHFDSGTEINRYQNVGTLRLVPMEKPVKAESYPRSKYRGG